MKTELKNEKHTRILIFSAYALLISALTLIFFKYLLEPLLPFIIAWIAAMLMRPAVDRACKRSKLPRRLIAFLCVTFVFCTVFSLLGIFLIRVLSELKAMSGGLMDDTAKIVNELFEAAEGLPFFKSAENTVAAERLKDTVTAMLGSALSSLCARIPDAVMTFASSLPGILLFAVTLILATFYLGADVGQINKCIIRLVPKERRNGVFEAKQRLMCAGSRYARAYLIILLMTFSELLIGFLALRIPYALTLAALIALIDILPVLGVGSVLVPWAVILFILKDTRTGLGLLILYGIIWLIRQITEPRLVGKSVGISPLLTLAAMYTGYSLIGFTGLFTFPIGIIAVKCIYEVFLKTSDTEIKSTE